MAHHEPVQATNNSEPVSKSAKILNRRQEENLPVFGHLVEHADATHLRYHEREDARNIELFFDLFFVAIFSTFTKNHEINSNEALSSYAVYFGVIWASWLQVCLYDVRFGFDSMFERSTKAIQMCAFIGFASTTATLEMSPTPEVGKEAALSGFQSLNFLMIVSRALFALQYAVAYVLVGRKHSPAKMPLLITTLMYASASIIYGLMYKLLLVDAGNASGFYGYYAIIAFELSVMSLVVARYECVSFKETHLHKRLMVLTLMILGEGIIVCAFSFAKISSKTGWTANSFGQALCVILSIVSSVPLPVNIETVHGVVSRFLFFPLLLGIQFTNMNNIAVLHLLPLLWQFRHRNPPLLPTGQATALRHAPSAVPSISGVDTGRFENVDGHCQRTIQLQQGVRISRKSHWRDTRRVPPRRVQRHHGCQHCRQPQQHRQDI